MKRSILKKKKPTQTLKRRTDETCKSSRSFFPRVVVRLAFLFQYYTRINWVEMLLILWINCSNPVYIRSNWIVKSSLINLFTECEREFDFLKIYKQHFFTFKCSAIRFDEVFSKSFCAFLKRGKFRGIIQSYKIYILRHAYLSAKRWFIYVKKF